MGRRGNENRAALSSAPLSPFPIFPFPPLLNRQSSIENWQSTPLPVADVDGLGKQHETCRGHKKAEALAEGGSAGYIANGHWQDHGADESRRGEDSENGPEQAGKLGAGCCDAGGEDGRVGQAADGDTRSGNPGIGSQDDNQATEDRSHSAQEYQCVSSQHSKKATRHEAADRLTSPEQRQDHT